MQENNYTGLPISEFIKHYCNSSDWISNLWNVCQEKVNEHYKERDKNYLQDNVIKKTISEIIFYEAYSHIVIMSLIDNPYLYYKKDKDVIVSISLNKAVITDLLDRFLSIGLYMNDSGLLKREYGNLKIQDPVESKHISKANEIYNQYQKELVKCTLKDAIKEANSDEDYRLYEERDLLYNLTRLESLLKNHRKRLSKKD